MVAGFDITRFCDELTALAIGSTRDRSGLSTLRRVIEVIQWTLGLEGAAFVEFGPAVGRVIVATGSAEIALGRRVESGDPNLLALLRGGAILVGPGKALPADVRAALDLPAKSGFVLSQVALGARPMGMVVAPLPDGPRRLSAEHRAILTFLTFTATRLYQDDYGLPLHADPAPRASSDTTVLLDGDGLVCWVNPRSVAVLDEGTVEVGKPLPVPIPGPGQVVEHNMPDGRWLKVISHRLPDGAGESIAIKDITEARRWEQSRELFVALTSHELRTPVTVIKGYADTLNDRWDALDDDGKRQAVRVLGQRAGDLARLLDRLLAAVGEPGIPPLVSRFNLAAAVTEALDAMPEETRGRVDARLADDLPSVFGEEGSIASVVSELITNAIKYTPPAAGPIELVGVSDARTVGLRVSDRGIGVRPEHVERAFERFWQADIGDHRRYGGVGLGLYLVRRIVERQHGWVSLRPRSSGGTVAEFRLPRGDLKPGEA